MTSEEYLKTLKNLKVTQENCLLYNTITRNNHLVSIKNLDDLLRIEDIITSIKVINKSKTFTKSTDNETPQNKKTQPFITTQDDFYNFLKSKEKFNFSICEYEEYNNIERGGIIGFTKEDLIRKESAKVSTDTHLAIIDYKTFQSTIELEQHKTNSKEMTYIHENFFFSGIKKSVFDLRYSKDFEILEFRKGNHIFVENSKLEWIAIIKEGNITTSINSNMLQLDKQIKMLINLDTSLITTKKYINEEFNLNFLKNFSEQLNKKKKFSIYNYNSKEVLGIEEYYFGINHQYTATVVSEKAKVFIFRNKKLDVLFSNEKLSTQLFKESALKQIDLLITRLINIKDNHIACIHSHSKYEDLLKSKYSALNSINEKNTSGVNIFRHKIKKPNIKIVDYANDNKIFDSSFELQEESNLIRNRVHNHVKIAENLKINKDTAEYSNTNIDSDKKLLTKSINNDLTTFRNLIMKLTGKENDNLINTRNKNNGNFLFEDSRIKILQQSWDSLQHSLTSKMKTNKTEEIIERFNTENNKASILNSANIGHRKIAKLKLPKIQGSPKEKKKFLYTSDALKPKFLNPQLNKMNEKLNKKKVKKNTKDSYTTSDM